MKKTIVNGYQIVFNEYWGYYQVSHKEIGAIVAEFNNLKLAKQYCDNG